MDASRYIVALVCLAAPISFGCASKARSAATVEAEVAAAKAELPLSARQIVERSQAAVVRIETPHGAGSGFIVRADGIVATAYHVIHAERTARVVLQDGREIPIDTVLVADRDHDVALVAVAEEDLPVLELGDSDLVALGDPVVTIGHTFGMPEQTATNGLISSVRRDEESELIQISSPISQGTSGGPVLDEHGRVVGTISLIAEGGQNVNFAIPSNELRRHLADVAELSREAGEAMAAFGERTNPALAEPIPPQLPLDPGTFDDCSDESRTKIIAELLSAIEIAAPVWVLGAAEATYRILEGSTLRLERDLDDCRVFLDTLSTTMIEAGQRDTPGEAVLVADRAFQMALELLFLLETGQ